MSSGRFAAALEHMALQPGILGCALVDASTGLVWHAITSVPDADRVWEAAIDYWRLHDRQKVHFVGLGTLRAAVMYHTGGVLAVFPCCAEPNVLLVCQGQHRHVDWITWQRLVRDLGQMIRDSGQRSHRPSNCPPGGPAEAARQPMRGPEAISAPVRHEPDLEPRREISQWPTSNNPWTNS